MLVDITNTTCIQKTVGTDVEPFAGLIGAEVVYKNGIKWQLAQKRWYNRMLVISYCKMEILSDCKMVVCYN